MKASYNLTTLILIIIAFLPLVFFENYLNGMQVPRIIVFWILIFSILFRNTIRLIFRKHSEKIIVNPITLSFSFYVFIYFVSSLFAQSPKLSFYSNFVRMDGFVSFSFYYLFYLIFSNTIIQHKNWFIIAQTSCLVAFFVSIIASQRIDYPYFRSSGTFSNPLTLAIYLLFHVFLIIHYIINFANFSSTKAILKFIVSLIFCLSYLAGIVFSQSRAAYLSLGVGIITLCIYLFLTEVRLRKRLLLVSSTSFLFATFLIFYFSKTTLLKRVTEFEILDNSTSSRFEIWKIVINKALENPFWGRGKEHFIYFFSKYYNNNFSESGDWYDRSHNFLIDKFIDHGFLGLLSYLILLATICWSLIKKNILIESRTKGILLSFLICYFVFHFTSFESFPSHLIFTCILIYISQNLAPIKLRVSKYFIGISSIFVLTITFWIIFKTSWTYFKWNNISNKNDLQTILEYEKLIPFAEIGKYDIVLKYDLIRNDVDSSSSPLYFQSAIRYTQELLHTYPNHPILLSQLGLIQMQNGNLKSAIETYLLLKQIAPNRHANLMDLGMLYLQNKEYGKALDTFNSIYKMDKNYEQALINKAYCYALKGNYEKSSQTLNLISTKNLVNHFDKIAEVYRMLNKQNILLEKLENVRYEERKLFKPTTYLQCLELAVLLGKNESIRKSIFYCLGYYGIKFDKNEVENMVAKIQERKLPPKVFYDKFKEARWGEYVVAYSQN